ncbi:MAG: hypothetical protein L6R39_004517 [Caloplaca ligustica]|nr:MAG: hypothetical protein L6R39_004517 [Caloplaca ligustica]
MGSQKETIMKLPAEIIINIFTLLPDFSDVFALAATCRRMTEIWVNNVPVIYRDVSRRSIALEHTARTFLADLGGPAADSTELSPADIRSIVRGACIVQKAIAQFEGDIVCRVRSKSWFFSASPAHTESIASGTPKQLREECYGRGARKHPPYLTPRKRSRFIRLYYRLWGLMKMLIEKQHSKLQNFTLKQLYRLHEMSKLPQSIGHEEVRSPHQWPSAAPKSFAAINWSRSQERADLEKRIRDHLDERYERYHGCKSDHPEIFAKEECSWPFIVIWDHWKPSLKDAVCGGQQLLADNSSWEYKREDLWDESSDED